MSWYRLFATVNCTGVYEIEADSEEEACQKFEQWTGGDDVTFSHYAEENTDEIQSVEKQ